MWYPPQTINCPNALAGLLNAGPPIYIKDPKSFPGDDAADPKGEVVALWFSADNSTISGQLKDAVLGAERDALWERLIAETMPRVKKLQAEIEAGGKAPAADAAGDA
jgi:hypothetical protein